jgi:UDP-sulfoquinovose synthase
MKILITGGDGFCGWPTSLKLASEGHDITIIDNLSRRSIDTELQSNSLTNIYSIEERLVAAKKQGWNISFFNEDVKNYNRLFEIVNQINPDSIVHFAEQRSAPYSMISEKQRRYTVENNVITTHNILNTIVDLKKDIHFIHLGTMGVYGYSKDFGEIPEGYLNIKINSTQKDVDILYPTNPGSIYHMSKSLDQILFQYYNKNWDLKITDLHQGIVWGTQTEQTKASPMLVNRFDYDGIYGTVLNRFVSQAATGNDITVYGNGGQTRAFIHIEDTAKCIQIACENEPKNTSKVRIFNQIAEIKSVKELAEICVKSYNGNIKYVENPRKELSKNELEVNNQGLKSLGFKPISLSNSLIDDIKFVALEMKSNLKKENILTSPKW